MLVATHSMLYAVLLEECEGNSSRSHSVVLSFSACEVAACQAKGIFLFLVLFHLTLTLDSSMRTRRDVQWRLLVVGSRNRDIFKGKGKVCRSWNPEGEEGCWVHIYTGTGSVRALAFRVQLLRTKIHGTKIERLKFTSGTVQSSVVRSVVWFALFHWDRVA